MSKKWIPNFVRKPIVKILNAFGRLQGKIYLAAKSGKIWFPDKLFQKWDYRVHTGKRLNLRNPQTYCEKLQWMKYYYRNPLYTKLVDKYAVREYVAEKIGEEYLVPLYGVWDHFDEIDFDALPDSFVLKCTHDQGSVILVPDKSKLDRDAAKAKLEAALKQNHFYLSREWPYKNVPPRIICEKFLFDENMPDPPDYKFFVFNNKVFSLLVNTHRRVDLKTNFYTPDFELMSMKEADYDTDADELQRPGQLEEMIACAENLASGMPHARVDFNLIGGKVYFGEITFYHCGGRKPFEPQEFDILFGKQLQLPPKMR